MIMWKSGKKFTSKSNERITVMKQLIKASYILLLVTFSVCSQATVYSSTYIVTDHLGSPVLATDDNGDTLWREDYSPYGAQLTNEDGDNSVGFTGHKDDKALGVTYMQGRWYHQEMGRFLAIDPVGFVEESPISFNRYAYANNNPYRYVDPDGNEAVPHIGPYLRGQFRQAEMQVYMMYGQFLMEEGATSAIGLGAGKIAGIAIKQAIKRGAPLVSGFTKSGVLDGANFAQKTFGKNFSAAGKFAGQTVDDVAASIQSGALKVSDVPIDYIVRNGNTLILNTRSSQALIKAGIPRSQWNTINRTGDAAFEARLTGQLNRNNLTEEGISTVRQSGGL